jgi:hypothetical protein
MARCFGDVRELVEKKKKRVTTGTPWWQRCSRRGERLGFAGGDLRWGSEDKEGKVRGGARSLRVGGKASMPPT